MIDLNDKNAISALDPKNVYGSTELFVNQCRQIYADVQKLSFPRLTIDNIIVCGMGGSAYGAYVAQSLFKDELKIPIFVNNDYKLPAFATTKSLIVLSSYSGNTEEVLHCAKEAKEKGYQITGITTGGKLAEFLQEQNFPALIVSPTNNPSGQPRLGTGYMVLGFLLLLEKLGLVSMPEAIEAISEVEKNGEDIKGQAKAMAGKMVDTLPLIFSAEIINGNAHIMRNQLNETAKVLAMFEDIPELNHHLMEGLINPKEKKISAIFLESSFYSQIIKKRVELTKDVIIKNNGEVLSFAGFGSSKLAHVLSTLSFGGYLSVYLAFLYNQNPSLIPWVDYFKQQLKNNNSFH